MLAYFLQITRYTAAPVSCPQTSSLSPKKKCGRLHACNFLTTSQDFKCYCLIYALTTFLCKTKTAPTCRKHYPCLRSGITESRDVDSHVSEIAQAGSRDQVILLQQKLRNMLT